MDEREVCEMKDLQESKYTVEGDFSLRTSESSEVKVYSESGEFLYSWPDMDSMINDVREVARFRHRLSVTQSFIVDLIMLDEPNNTWRQVVTLQELINRAREVGKVIDAPVCYGPPPHLDIPDPNCSVCGYAI